jgi:hypothetical protein
MYPPDHWEHCIAAAGGWQRAALSGRNALGPRAFFPSGPNSLDDGCARSPAAAEVASRPARASSWDLIVGRQRVRGGVPPPPLTFTVHKYTIGCRGFRCLASWRSSAYKCPVGAGRPRERPRAGLREMRARHPWPPTLGVRARRAIAVSARAPPIRQRKWWIADRGSGIAVRGSGIGDPGSGIGRVGSRGAAKSRRRIGNVTKTTTTTSDVSPLQPVVGQSLSTPFACLPFRQRPATERPIRQRGEPPARRKLRTCDEGYPD